MTGIPQIAVDFISRWERLRLKAYYDVAGYPTQGYGHLLSRNKQAPLPPDITLEQAKEWLHNDLARAASVVRATEAQCREPFTDNEFAALLSLAFNIGISAFASSSLTMHLKRGDKRAAADQFGSWRYAGGKVVEGLVKRRAAERELFLTPQPASGVGAA